MSCHWRRLMGNEAKQTISVGEKRDGKRLRSGFYLQVISHAGILRSRRDGFEALKRGRGPDSSLVLVRHKVVSSLPYLLPEPYPKGAVHLPGGDLSKLSETSG